MRWRRRWWISSRILCPMGPPLRPFTYEISGSRAVLSGRVYGTYAKDAVLVLPVIPAQAQVLTVPVADPPQHIFFLTGGFGAEEEERALPGGSYPMDTEISLQEAVDEYEKSLIKYACEKYGSTRKAAKAIGISQTQLVRKKKKYNL